MYSQLLVTSSELGPEYESSEEPLAHLLDCRRRLDESRRDSRAGDRDEPVGALADNIVYDLALIRFCTGEGIACDARQFGRPLLERRRLEEELAKLGIDLVALD